VRPHEGAERIAIGARLHAGGASVPIVTFAPLELHAVGRVDAIRRLHLAIDERFIGNRLALFPSDMHGQPQAHDLALARPRGRSETAQSGNGEEQRRSRQRASIQESRLVPALARISIPSPGTSGLDLSTVRH
jgi:hypothetical protein